MEIRQSKRSKRRKTEDGYVDFTVNLKKELCSDSSETEEVCWGHQFEATSSDPRLGPTPKEFVPNTPQEAAVTDGSSQPSVMTGSSQGPSSEEFVSISEDDEDIPTA